MSKTPEQVQVTLVLNTYPWGQVPLVAFKVRPETLWIKPKSDYR